MDKSEKVPCCRYIRRGFGWFTDDKGSLKEGSARFTIILVCHKIVIFTIWKYSELSVVVNDMVALKANYP